MLIREVYRSPALARQASFPESSTKDDSSGQDIPDADELLDDAPDPSYLADDEEREPFSETVRTERVNALLSSSAAPARSDSLAV